MSSPPNEFPSPSSRIWSCLLAEKMIIISIFRFKKYYYQIRIIHEPPVNPNCGSRSYLKFMVVGRRKSLNIGTYSYFEYPPLRKHRDEICKSVFGDFTSEPNPQALFRNPCSDAPVVTRPTVTYLSEVRVRHLRFPLSAKQLCTHNGKDTYVKIRDGFFDDGLGWTCKFTIQYKNTDTKSNLFSGSFGNFDYR